MRRSIVVIIVWLSAAAAAGCTDPNRIAEPALPEALAGAGLRSTMTGVPANKFMVRMHGRVTGSRGSAVGTYGAEPSSLKLYVSVFETPGHAAQALQKMSKKMAAGSMGFEPPALMQTAGGPVFRTAARGIDHFFFQAGAFVVWLQAEPDRAEEALAQVQRFQFSIDQTAPPPN